MVKDYSECCMEIKESNLYDRDWLEEDVEYKISELEVDDTEIIEDCLNVYNYQKEYINFLLGGCSEEEFMKIAKTFAKGIKPGESMWDDPFDKLKTIIGCKGDCK
jgi:hypothetical protein